jgi:hypothetical protein
MGWPSAWLQLLGGSDTAAELRPMPKEGPEQHTSGAVGGGQRQLAHCGAGQALHR